MTSSGFETYLECFLWDLVDEGIEGTLDRIKGETGVTGIVVPVHCPFIQQFRPHAGVSPRTFVSDGGAQFQPEPSRYAGTRLRPVPAGWLRKRNPLKPVAEACHQRGLKMGGAVFACSNGPVARRYEHACVRDVFGDRNGWLCPVNPDVQEYVRGLLADLTENYALDFVQLDDLGFCWSRSGFPYDEPRGPWLGPIEFWLRTICFCESCRQLAGRDGIDVDAVASLVRDTLQRACDTGNSLPGIPRGFVQEHPRLDAYLQWRSSQLHVWAGSLRRTCRCALVLHCPPPPITSGVEVGKLNGVYDVLLCDCDALDVRDVDDTIRRASDACQPKPGNKLSLRLSARADCSDAGALVAAVGMAAELGCHSVWISDYGTIPLARLDWIRQAVRYGHRQARRNQL
ncbi:MAG: hypothetical protein HY718_09115 [Planctomycetes bacterium]|nr:hypothetical protein [Planctomycetota bacterium]